MEEYAVFTDFTTLSKKQANDWVEHCSALAEEAFRNYSDSTRLLGNLLILEQYYHTICQGMAENEEEPEAIWQESLDLLWNYLYGTVQPEEFADFANNLYACVLEYMVGEELTDEQQEFYENHFQDSSDYTCQWNILSWTATLLMELTAIHGGKVEEEFLDCEQIDFVEVDEMLNFLSEVCIELAEVECESNHAADVIKAFEDVCVTPLFQSVVSNIQKALKDAWHATPEQYQTLREAYQKNGILPDEYAAELLEF